jgi:hypothetical protein
MLFDPSGHFSLTELKSVVTNIGTLARLVVQRVVTTLARAAAQAGNAIVQAFTRSVSWAWNAGRSGHEPTGQP